MNKMQKGFGYAELLVALAISTVALLAIYSLQLRWTAESINSFKTSKALSLASEMHNKIAASKDAKDIFAKAFANTNAAKAFMNINCIDKTCSTQNKIEEDAYHSYRIATSQDLKAQIAKCRTTDRNCIYIAWGKTEPISDDSNVKSCTTAQTGTENYRKDSTCVVLESF